MDLPPLFIKTHLFPKYESAIATAEQQALLNQVSLNTLPRDATLYLSWRHTTSRDVTLYLSWRHATSRDVTLTHVT